MAPRRQTEEERGPLTLEVGCRGQTTGRGDGYSRRVPKAPELEETMRAIHPRAWKSRVAMWAL